MGEGARRTRSGFASFLSLERNVLIMSATALMINFGAQTFQFFQSPYLQTLKADIPDVAIVGGAVALATALVSIPGGKLTDKFGRKAIIVLGNAIGYGAYFALLFVKTWTAALPILFVATIFTTLVQPAYSSTVAESVSVSERSKAFGSFLLFAYMGLTFGTVIGGYLSYQIAIVIVATVGLVSGLSRFVFLRETFPREARARQQSQSKSSFFVRMPRNVWLLLIALLTFNFFSGLGQSLYTIFALDNLGLSKPQLGLMGGLGYGASMIGVFLAGQVSRRLGIRKMMGLGVVLTGLLLLPWIYSPDPLFAVAIFAPSAFFAQFFYVGNFTLQANLTRTEERGSIIGVITTIALLGSIVSNLLGGQLWVLVSPRTPFLVSALLTGVVTIPLVFIKEPSRTISCPHCSRNVPQEAKFCDMCSKPIHFKKCVGCDRVLEESARFCDLCGRDQPKQKVPQEITLPT